MAWRGWVWAAMLAGAMAGEARAASVDCWLLDGDRKAQAVAAGLCDDAFSRNSKPGEPPVAAPPRKPDAKPALKPASLRRPPVSGGSHGTPARLPRDGSGDGFASRFQRDFGALVDRLGGGSAGRRSDGGSPYPSHNGH